MWLLGATSELPADPRLARSTIEPVDNTTPAEIDAAPDWNETATDRVPNPGLTMTTMGGHVVPSERYVNPVYDMAHQDHLAPIDEQVATAGRAPAIERNGTWGHGTMMRTESIQPVIRDGGALGNDVFLRDSRPVQEGATAQMLPDQVDAAWQGVAARAAQRNSRLAFAETLRGATGWQS